MRPFVLIDSTVQYMIHDKSIVVDNTIKIRGQSSMSNSRRSATVDEREQAKSLRLKHDCMPAYVRIPISSLDFTDDARHS